MRRLPAIAVLTAAVLVLAAGPAYAQRGGDVVKQPGQQGEVDILVPADQRILIIVDGMSGQSKHMVDRIKSLLDQQYAPPVEPHIPPVKYIKPEEPYSLKDRVDGLLHGIKTDIPPQYDHYGYEIRRYMARIAGKEVLSDTARIEQELNNLRSARIVLNYWSKDIAARIEKLGTDLEVNPAHGGPLRGTFKYNAGVASAFLTECSAWINNNEKMLKFLLEKSRAQAYNYKDPVMVFDVPEDSRTMNALYKAQVESLANIREYMPFMQMVY